MSLRYRIVVVACLNLVAMTAHAKWIQVYTDHGSVRVGEAVNFFISSDVATCVSRPHVSPHSGIRLVLAESVPVIVQPVPSESPWEAGAGWELTFSFVIPEDWEPGLYDFRVRAVSDNSYYRRFQVSVLPDELGEHSRIAMLLNDATRNAYNEWGGKSNYKSLLSDDPGRAPVVAFNRPDTYTYGWIDWDFFRWADLAGMPVEYLTTLDLHYEAAILDAYDILVLAGHSEYWSREMRAALEAFLARGGKLVSLSGNTMWWSVRFADGPNGVQMISCKGAISAHPECSSDPELYTGYWSEMGNPETRVMGASFRYGGYVDSHGYYTYADGYGGYFAQEPMHWFWAGTSVLRGDQVGREAGIAGYEADAPPLVYNRIGDLIADPAAPDLPAGIQVLGTTPAANKDWEGNGAIIYFPVGDNGGEVFNCGSVDCSAGLRTDPAWRKAVLNVFTRFGAFGPARPVATDYDFDGINDGDDNCIDTYNPEQVDSMSDGTGDECDRHCH